MNSRPTSQETDPVLKPYWEKMRDHNYAASFPDVSNFIYQNASKIKRPARRRTNRVWMLSLFLLPLLALFSFQRKTYVDAQGATLTFSVTDSMSHQVEEMVRKYAKKDWEAVFKTSEGKRKGIVNTSAEQYERLKEFSQNLKAMPGVNEIYMSALNTAIEESRLSRLTYNLFDVHIGEKDATDEELRREITLKLKETDQQNLHLELMKVNGRKQVDLGVAGNSQNFSLNFTLQDGTTVTAIAEKW